MYENIRECIVDDFDLFENDSQIVGHPRMDALICLNNHHLFVGAYMQVIPGPHTPWTNLCLQVLALNHLSFQFLFVGSYINCGQGIQAGMDQCLLDNMRFPMIGLLHGDLGHSGITILSNFGKPPRV